MKRFKKGEINAIGLVGMCFAFVVVAAVIGIISSPPTLDWALTKVTGSGYVVFATGEYATIQTNLDNIFY